jgi:hypothetical protein
MPRFLRCARACLLVVLSCLALPAAASAYVDDMVTLDGLNFPSNKANTATSSEFVGHTSGRCDASGNGTFSFRVTGEVVVAGADGRFEESGTFTIATSGGQSRVTAFASTFTASSPTAPVVSGTRGLDATVPSRATCVGTTDATRGVRVDLFTSTEIAFELETYPGDAREGRDRGPSEITISDYAADASPSPYENAAGYYDAYFTSDRDGDGRRIHFDNCPNVANADQADADGDQVGDVCDADRDGDGKRNTVDNCPQVRNADQADRDRDGIGDVCDPVDDTPLVVDADGDGVADPADNCVEVPNAGQVNTGGTARGDACEDRDADAVLDAADNCADAPNADQANTGGSLRGDACEDRDADQVLDAVDSCADDANTDQADADGDRRGDVCDPDDDNDGVADVEDVCPLAADPQQRDSDGDGRGDACDGAFDSSDGHATGGGFLAGAGDARTHLSFSARSTAGKLAGSGQVRDGQRTIRLTGVTGLHRSGARAVVVGTATTGAGEATYRLEVVDGGEPGGADTVDLEVAGERFAGTLAGGNLQVR